jgi:hypothetical protein
MNNKLAIRVAVNKCEASMIMFYEKYRKWSHYYDQRCERDIVEKHYEKLLLTVVTLLALNAGATNTQETNLYLGDATIK